VRIPSIAERKDEGRPELEGSGRTLAEAEGIIRKTEPIHPKGATSAHSERPRRGTQYLIGKRAKVVASSSRGRYVWHEMPRDKPRDIAFGPTMRAAAPYQRHRKSDDGLALVIRPEDVRIKMREYRAPFSIVLVVDMSLSMANSIINLGRAVFSLHRSVYRRRDRVALVVFKGTDAAVLQQPTTNLGLIVKKLWNIGTSDFTPIASGMLRAWRLLRLEKQRNRDVIPMMILVSDGIANVPLGRPLSSWGRRMFMSRAQADVLDVAHLLKRSGIRTIVINTSHRKAEIPGEAFKKAPSKADWFTPTEFLMETSRVMGGSYYGLGLAQEPSMHMSKTKLNDWFYLEAEAK
jgi:magnesium chelatase subunit D